MVTAGEFPCAFMRPGWCVSWPQRGVVGRTGAGLTAAVGIITVARLGMVLQCGRKIYTFFI